jgi:hypothetical protein
MVGLTKQGFKISLANFIDDCATAQNIHVVYDKTLTDATVVDKSIDSWVSFNFGNIEFGNVCEAEVMAYVLTRKDPEGYMNDMLFDQFFSFFSDPVMPDGNKRIPFHEVAVTGTDDEGKPIQELVQTATMWLARITPLVEFILMDDTKVCPTRLYFRWFGSL